MTSVSIGDGNPLFERVTMIFFLIGHHLRFNRSIRLRATSSALSWNVVSCRGLRALVNFVRREDNGSFTWAHSYTVLLLPFIRSADMFDLNIPQINLPTHVDNRCLCMCFGEPSWRGMTMSTSRSSCCTLRGKVSKRVACKGHFLEEICSFQPEM